MSDPTDPPEAPGDSSRDARDERETRDERPSVRTRRPGFVRRHWGKLTFATLVLLPVLVVVLWTTIALAFSYSDGTRTGYNQKLSRKGWLCKTWEGEIALTAAPGVAPEIFRYSVRDDGVARAIQALEGQRVTVSYEQHKGLPTSCFGETEYFATGVQRVAP
jgi:hypothetical protein